jgi:hypothetical protein
MVGGNPDIAPTTGNRGKKGWYLVLIWRFNEDRNFWERLKLWRNLGSDRKERGAS